MAQSERSPGGSPQNRPSKSAASHWPPIFSAGRDVEGVNVLQAGVAQQKWVVLRIEAEPVFPVAGRLKTLQVEDALDRRVAGAHSKHAGIFRPAEEVNIPAVARPVGKADVAALHDFGPLLFAAIKQQKVLRIATNRGDVAAVRRPAGGKKILRLRQRGNGVRFHVDGSNTDRSRGKGAAEDQR